MTVLKKNGWVPVLDDANLMFHEAGHVIYGILGSTVGWYGGTLGQLSFPVIVAVTFWRKDEIVGFSFGVWWFFQNLVNIARYMADARAGLLPLVGGGEHDWAHIFGEWGILSSDTSVAAVFRFVGWIGMVAIWLWAFRVWANASNEQS